MVELEKQIEKCVAKWYSELIEFEFYGHIIISNSNENSKKEWSRVK
jgi:hypothetical protein